MTVHFIGAGPGAPDLITVRGLRLIERCPVCLYAGSLVPREIVAAAPPGARVVDTAPLTLDEIVAEIEAAHRQDIEIAVVGGSRVLEDCVLVVLGMRRGEISAVKIEIVLLLAMIGQRLARNLSSGDTSTVGEYRKKQGIHAGTFVKHIEDFLGTFIHKRNCSDLDADHFRGDKSMS